MLWLILAEDMMAQLMDSEDGYLDKRSSLYNMME